MSEEVKKPEQLVLLGQVHDDWKDFLEPLLLTPEFERIWRTIRGDASRLAPRPSRVFRVLQMPMEKIKVIVIGQDPYINMEAEGLAFSSILGLTPSLRAIFNEIARTEGKFRLNASLKDWEDQGVFLINTNLTTVIGKSLAHDKIGWPFITKAILRRIDKEKKEPFIVLAWGNHAKITAQETITQNNDKVVLKHTHPAARFQEFTGCGHFRRANEFLTLKGLSPIDWVGKGATDVD